jgi:hypothetical protein
MPMTVVMRARGDRRRLRVIALSGCAAAMACAIAVAPMVVGARSAQPGATSFLNRAEGGGFDHNRAHISASRAAKRRALARRKLCARAATRAVRPRSCPARPPTLAQAHEARVAGEGTATLASTQPDGLWGPLLSIPSTAIHAIVLPTNKILYISQPKYPTEDEAIDGGNAHVWDPATNTSRAVPPPDVPYPTGPDRPANLWCGGQTTLADGRVLVVGGNLAYPSDGGIGAGNGFRGGKWVMTFDPWTETWTRYADMPHGRWYPTLTELPDGRVLIVGGWDESGGLEGPGGPGDAPSMVNDQDVEVFDPATPAGGTATTVVSALPPNGPAQPSPYPDHQGIGLYPHMFVLPDTTTAGAGGDKVLVAGPIRYDSAIIDTSTWVWTDVVDLPDVGQARISSDRSWGTAWLAPSGPGGSTRVVLLGGSDAGAAGPGPGTSTAPLATAEVLDLDDPTAGWSPEPALALNRGRAHFNTVLLPDGSIFSNGGGYGRKADSLYLDPVYTAELYTPGGGWREVGEEADARTYHSTSVLLPDGRVASAGDDRDVAPEHISLGGRTAQLWSPPYLFDGPRPEVTFAPQSVRYDAPFRIAVSGAPSGVTRAVLVRPGAVTHSVDMSQRSIALDLTAQADGLTLRSPLNATVAPPGYYMLFVLNADGVPSVASWVKLDPTAADAPALPASPAAPGAGLSAAPAPPGTPTLERLRVTVLRPRVTVRRGRVRVELRLRTNLRANAHISLIRPAGDGRKTTDSLGGRTVTLRPGRTLRSTLTLRLARLGTLRSLRVSVVARDPAGARLIINRIAELPLRR